MLGMEILCKFRNLFSHNATSTRNVAKKNKPGSHSFIIFIDMTEEPKKEEMNFEAFINNMSSINSEDYWFKKVSHFEEHDETVPGADQSNPQNG